MAHPFHCCSCGFLDETPDQRQQIIDDIRINGQPLKAVHWPQTDSIMRIKVPNGFRGIIYPDSHSPFVSWAVLRAICYFADTLWRPHLAFELGDFFDFQKFSRFPFNSMDGTPYPPVAEAELTARSLRMKMRAGRPARLIASPGNHDDRARQQSSGDARIFADYINLRSRSTLADLVTAMLGIRESEPIMFCWGAGLKGGREGGVMVGDLRLRHGNFVDAKPGYSAYKHVMKHGVNTVMGHTHRGGKFAFETKPGRVRYGGELFYNADPLSPAMNYISQDTDAIHGFGVITAHDDIIHLQPIPFLIGEDEKANQQEYFVWMDRDFNMIEFPIQDI